MTSPRQIFFFSVSCTVTSSPGAPCRTKITRPSWRAIACPPWTGFSIRTTSCSGTAFLRLGRGLLALGFLRGGNRGADEDPRHPEHERPQGQSHPHPGGAEPPHFGVQIERHLHR